MTLEAFLGIPEEELDNWDGRGADQADGLKSNTVYKRQLTIDNKTHYQPSDISSGGFLLLQNKIH